MKLHSRLCAASLVVLASTATIATNFTLAQASSRPQNPNSIQISKRTTLQPGINRVTFKSEGQTLVGNLYVITRFCSSMPNKLPFPIHKYTTSR